MEPKLANCKNEKINHSNIYLVLIYSGARNVFRKTMQNLFLKFVTMKFQHSIGV